MKSKSICRFAIVVLLAGAQHSAFSQEKIGSKPVPQSRAAMLKALDALKRRSPRLPLPAAEVAATKPASTTTAEAGSQPTGLSSMGVVNNGRMRSLYLPAELQTRGGRSRSNSDSELPYEFSTELFWIVSRLNNCHYCLGHQESKLKSAGVSEETLLALDTDWSSFPAMQRAAFEFTRQLTFAPHTIGNREIEQLQLHFSDQQILDIAFMVGRYNSTNRWTDSLGIPQEDHRDYASTLDSRSLNLSSRVAVDGFAARPAFQTFADWKIEFDKQSTRAPRLEFVTPQSDGDLAPHERLLMSIPAAGSAYVEQFRNARLVGELPDELKNKIVYVAAREDHAWYMQHVARQRLLEDGMDEQAIFSLVNNPGEDSAEVAALRFVSKLTKQPQWMSDSDIQDLQKHFSPHQIAEIVYHTGKAAILNRVTEVAGLPW